MWKYSEGQLLLLTHIDPFFGLELGTSPPSGVQPCIPRDHQITCELFTWQWIFWGVKCIRSGTIHTPVSAEASCAFSPPIYFPEICPPETRAVSGRRCLRGWLGACQGPGVPSGCVGIAQAPSPAPTCSTARHQDGAVHWPLTEIRCDSALDMIGLSPKAGRNPSWC